MSNFEIDFFVQKLIDIYIKHILESNLILWYYECAIGKLQNKNGILTKVECHFFNSIIKKINKNKMIAMNLKTLITKVLVLNIIKPFSFKIKDRHSTDIPYMNYIKKNKLY